MHLEDRLKSRLCNEAPDILLWRFDAIEKVTVSSNIKKRRWSTETIKLDNMFLEKSICVYLIKDTRTPGLRMYFSTFGVL